MNFESIRSTIMNSDVSFESSEVNVMFNGLLKKNKNLLIQSYTDFSKAKRQSTVLSSQDNWDNPF